jgi:D-alanyl-D-alanine carboxypeptidase
MLFEEIGRGEMTLKSKLTVSARASRQPSSKMWLAPGSQISAENVILGLVCGQPMMSRSSLPNT